MIERTYMTVAEVAEYFGTSEGFVYKLVKGGDLSPVLKVGNKFIRIPISTVKHFEEDSCKTTNKKVKLTESGSGFGEGMADTGTLQPGLGQAPSAYQLGQKFSLKQRSLERSL